MDVEQPICRICFTGADDDAQQLVSPCKCQGSQKYIHVACLRQWQRSVQLDAPNHPHESDREERHRVCNVCKSAFEIEPQDRAAMMSDLACVRPEEIVPGMLLVTKSAASESAARNSQLNLVIRAYIEMKAAHFREAVYILTEIRDGEATDGSDAVLGVNLSRTLEHVPDVAKLEAAPDEAALMSYAKEGVHVQWMNGGPCKPRVVSSLVCVRHLPPSRRAELCTSSSTSSSGAVAEQHEPGIREIISGASGVLFGTLPEMLPIALEEAELARDAGEPCMATVFAWAGFAQWSRTQLLGEIARGSWGWCNAEAADVDAAQQALQFERVSLWSSLRPCDRLKWAPDNELSREFRERHDRLFQRMAGEAPEEQGQAGDAATVDAYVEEFEARRRGSDPRQRQSRRPSAGPVRSCTQQ